MSFNPLEATKNFFNQSTNTMEKTYNKVSSDVVNLITPIVQTVKPNVVLSQPAKTNFIQPVKNIEQEMSSIQLAPFESKYESQYIGCFADDPVNPSMDTFLGQITNIAECIDMGKNKDFKYVGIRSGNQCYASNLIPKTQSVDRFKYCNIGCDEIGTGNCGGFFYNQVYKTTPIVSKNNQELNSEQDLIKKINKEKTNEVVGMLENFISTDNDLKKISIGLSSDNFNCWKPINMYVIFFWLIILLFLIYLLFEYLYKKKHEKMI